MAATTTTAWVIDRGQYVPHRDENVAILVRAPLTECLDGRDERGYGCGHGRPPRRSSWTSSTHNDPGTSRARPACTPTRRVRPAPRRHSDFELALGQPWRNGYVESFNGRVRDECLNINSFWSLPHARVVITDWKNDYNHHRRHSSLGYQAPADYAAGCTHQ